MSWSKTAEDNLYDTPDIYDRKLEDLKASTEHFSWCIADLFNATEVRILYVTLGLEVNSVVQVFKH